MLIGDLMQYGKIYETVVLWFWDRSLATHCSNAVYVGQRYLVEKTGGLQPPKREKSVVFA